MYEGFAGCSDVHSSSTERCGRCGSSLLTADLTRVGDGMGVSVYDGMGTCVISQYE